jgi:outer membrane protein assembly factor BamB
VNRLAAALLVALSAGCGAGVLGDADPTRAVPHGDPGRPVLSLRWSVTTSDRAREVKPQEFAVAALDRDTLYVGSAGGVLLALDPGTGAQRWKRRTGSVSAPAVAARGVVFVGTDDGVMLALDAQTGAERWRHASAGPILEAPVLVATPSATPGASAAVTLAFANEAGQVIALDAATGAPRWQYAAEKTSQEYTLRGHAGLALHDGLLFTGFANGTLVALRAENGSVAWLTSLAGDAQRFVDVDATPLVVGDTLYAASSSGGAWALDAATGLVRWRTRLGAPGDVPEGAVGGLATDGERLFVGVADRGIHALDLAGNVLWRQGTRGGGEPAALVVSEDYLLYALADAGLYVADRRTGEVLQYFDPGDGVSAAPLISPADVLYVLSNRGVLYAMGVTRF